MSLQRQYRSLCEKHEVKERKPLTLVLLQCWQREQSRRPYDSLIINGRLFEEKYHRRPDEKDINVIEEFLENQSIKHFGLHYIPCLNGTKLNQIIVKLPLALEQLSLCHVDMGADALQLLVNAAEKLQLKFLRLGGNEFSDAHAKHLRKFLIKNKTIQSLDIAHCSLNHITFATVADGIIRCPSLKAIDVSRLVNITLFSLMDASKISLIIAIIIKSKPLLLEMNFRNCCLNGLDLDLIAEYLPLSSLSYLNLGSNSIGGNGIEKLLQALRKLPKLIGLDVSNNGIGSDGGEIIAHLLPFTNIRYLDISRNGISAEIMRFILLTIKKPPTIRVLNIIGNDFDHEVGLVLYKYLDAKVICIHSIDVNVTYEVDKEEFRIVPQMNNAVQFNQRCDYKKTTTAVSKAIRLPKLQDGTGNKISVNEFFVDSISINTIRTFFTTCHNENIKKFP